MLSARVVELGFRDGDLAAVLSAAEQVARQPQHLETVAAMAERLLERLGDFTPRAPAEVWAGQEAHRDVLGTGVLPMLALVVTAPAVAAFHRGRGVPDEISRGTLADLGQQVWIHRLTFAEFGLHTQGWLCCAWSGALYWLGRLQFNLELDRTVETPQGSGEWVLSTHIPRTGPLESAAVDQSFAAATEFFARYFPEYPTRDFFCQSWLLDPEVSRLMPGSNMAAFQQRWTLYGAPQPGDLDTLFFTFNVRRPVDPDSLPRDTTLQRVVADRLKQGKSWSIVQGRLAQADVMGERLV